MIPSTRRVLFVASLLSGVALALGANWTALQAAQSALASGCLALIDVLQARVLGGMAGVAIAAGLAIMFPLLVSLARQLVRTYRFVGHALQTEQDEQPQMLRRVARRAGLDGRIRLVDSPDVLAFCFGLWRPRVCVSTAVLRELSEPQLEAILRHEAWHVRRRDPLRSLLANAIAAACWFVPLAGELVRVYKIRQELAADAGAVHGMRGPVPLAGALYHVAMKHDARLAPLPATGAFGALDARIDYLVDGSPPPIAPRTRPAGLIITAVVLGGTGLALCLLLMSAQLSAVGQACLPC